MRYYIYIIKNLKESCQKVPLRKILEFVCIDRGLSQPDFEIAVDIS